MLQKSEAAPWLKISLRGSRGTATRTPLILGIIALLVVGGGGIYIKQQAAKQAAKEQLIPVVEPKTVTALGNLEPQGEVIKLSAPTSTEGTKIEKLLVEEGQTVKAGQLVAILDSQGRLQASVNEANEKVRVAQASLAKVKAGAKLGEIEAQKAAIALEEAELSNAQAEYKRYNALYRQGAISASNEEGKRLTLQTAQQKLNQAKANLKQIEASGKQQIAEAQANLRRIEASGQQQVNEARANLRKIEISTEQQVKENQFTLNKIAEVRPVDVIAAEAEVKSARASLKRAEENLAQAYIKSPQDGQIFEIYTRPGEVIGNDGIADIGKTSQMYGVLEVYHSDINKVRLGQKVKITSNSLSTQLQGTVERVGIQVKRQNVINADPSSNIDDRVVEVHVRLDKVSSQKAAKFTNLQIQAVIELDSQ